MHFVYSFPANQSGNSRNAIQILLRRGREAIVIAPSREIEHYVEVAAAEGMIITCVAETHIHADFVSGAKEMAARIGAKLNMDGGMAAWQSANLPMEEQPSQLQSTLLICKTHQLLSR